MTTLEKFLGDLQTEAVEASARWAKDPHNCAEMLCYYDGCLGKDIPVDPDIIAALVDVAKEAYNGTSKTLFEALDRLAKLAEVA